MRVESRVSRWSNAKVFLVSEPPWSVTAAWMSSYLTLYLLARHASVEGIGLAIGISGFIVAMLLPMVGWLSGMVGRKAVIQTGDFLGWIVALLIWVVDPTPLLVLVALVLNQLSHVVTPAWNSLFSEDISEDALASSYLVLQVLTVLGGMVVPVVAIWEQRVGMAHAGRLVLAVALPLLALAIAMRQRYLRESSVERAEREARRKGTFAPPLARLRPALQGPGGILAALRVLGQVSFSLFATFGPVMLVDRNGLALPIGRLAFLPLAASILGIGMWFGRRWLVALSSSWSFLVSIAALTLGFALFAIKAPGGFVTIWLAWGLVMAGQNLFWSSHTTFWMRWVPDAARVDIQGYVGSLGSLMITVVGPLSARWIAAHPILYDWGNVGVGAVMAGLWVLLMAYSNRGLLATLSRTG